MTNEREETTALAPLAPRFVIGPTDIKVRIEELQKFVGEYMIEGEDYGTIPGTAKPTLYKSGAEKLCDVYGFQRLFQTMNRVEDWEKGLFHYEIRADLVDSRTGLTVAQGLGSANTMEARYRWRKEERKCPMCQEPAIIKGKEEFGGGWVCWKKKGGCGSAFDDFDDAIMSQKFGRIENDDPYTLVNTILKMAKKRALVDAVLSATRSSGLFTQDMEDTARDVIEGESRVIDEVGGGQAELPSSEEPAPSPASAKTPPKKRRRAPAKSQEDLAKEASSIRNNDRPWRCAKCKDERSVPAVINDCPYCGHHRGSKIEEPAATSDPEAINEPHEASKTTTAPAEEEEAEAADELRAGGPDIPEPAEAPPDAH